MGGPKRTRAFPWVGLGWEPTPGVPSGGARGGLGASYLGRPARSRAGCGACRAGRCPQAGEAAAGPGAGRRGPAHSCGCSCSSQTKAPAHSPLQGDRHAGLRGGLCGSRALRGVPWPGPYHSRPRQSRPGSQAAGHSATRPAGTPRYRSSAGSGSRGLGRPAAQAGPWWASGRAQSSLPTRWGKGSHVSDS